MAINLTHEAFAKSAVQFRKELIMMLTIGLQATLQHMTLRPGIQYKQTVGEIGGNAQYGPYDPTRKNTTTDIKAREIEVFLGSVIKEFDPNTVYQSILGSLMLNGDALKNVPITKAILAAEMKSLSAKLNMALFPAVRNQSGTTSNDLFNGFDTIAQTEITAGAIAANKGNFLQLNEAITNSNAVDVLKSIWNGSSDEIQEYETVKLFIPRSVYNAYNEDYKTTTGAAPYNKEFKKTFLEGSDDRCELVPLASKKNSQFIQMTTKDNMLVGTGNGNDLETLNVDRFAPFTLTLSSAILFGCQYETISKEKLMIAKLYQGS
jgi:hypothetical protein